jgi:hydroxymethylpyrimidine/phosphomethylpyrimidine kinase
MNRLTTTSPHQPRALTIAGSDSCGGAGIQADLKTFASLGVYGMSAITAVTAQNTTGVRAVSELPTDIIVAQIDAVIEDIGVDTAKTGMLFSPAIIEAIADRVRHWKLRLVVDPVMIAKSGAALLQPSAITVLMRQLLPLAEVVTPNLPEAEVLTERGITTLEEMQAAAQIIRGMGPRYVIIKGGHRTKSPTDVLYDGQCFMTFPAERINTPHTHGTGCTFSAAIAAYLARGAAIGNAVTQAKQYITQAIKDAPGLGHGYGPVQHFWQYQEVML